MKVWALTDGPVKEGKYLVVRRDGTIPPWGHFVLSEYDKASADALRAYAKKGLDIGYSQEFCDSVLDLADRYDDEAATNADLVAAKKGGVRSDPKNGPHRKDNPAIVALMRGEGDLTDYDPDRTASMEVMLARCMEQFEFYEKQHRAKGTPEADAKAEVNKEFAETIQALLAR